jgi:hypothetical protein
MNGWPGTQDFAWIRDPWLASGASFTFVEDDDVERVAARYGGRLDDAFGIEGAVPLEEALEVVDQRVAGSRFGAGPPVALFGHRDGWVLGFDDTSAEMVHDPALEQASQDARVFSVFWNVNFATAFSFAQGGQVQAKFTDGAPTSVHGADPGRIDAVLEGLGWDGAIQSIASMFALSARLMGQTFTPDWLVGEWLAVPLVQWPRRRNADGRMLLPQLDGALGDAMRSADQEPLRRATFAAAEYAATAAGIADHPVIAEALSGWPLRPPLLERMARSLAQWPTWSPMQLMQRPQPAPRPMPASGRPGGAASPEAVAATEALRRRIQGYPDGVSYREPGHALAVVALMWSTEPLPPVVSAYRTICFADQARRDLQRDVAELREVVMRAFG